jgi:hypothetical protein
VDSSRIIGAVGTRMIGITFDGASLMHISPPHSLLSSVARRSAISNRRSGLLKHLKA